MNVGISEMLANVRKIDLRNALPRLIEETGSGIIRLNQKELKLGLLSTGEQIQPKYKSTPYAKKKNALNPAPGFGVPDEYVTGAFYSKFYVKASLTAFETGSTDEKAARLEGFYSQDQYGIADKDIPEYAIDILLPKVMQYINEVSGL